MAMQDGAAEGTNPVLDEVRELDTGSAVAVVGHPIHAMMVHFPIALVIATFGTDIFYWWSGDAFWVRAGLWSAGFAFWTAVAAGLVGTAELLLVPGIRVRVQSWSHAVAAMTLIAVAGMNWGLRVAYPEMVLPHGLALSGLASVMAGFAGYHGGKLVFDHGMGILVSSKN
ncbi:DUF2231 domain-containing protein [soil metagenome]